MPRRFPDEPIGHFGRSARGAFLPGRAYGRRTPYWRLFGARFCGTDCLHWPADRSQNSLRRENLNDSGRTWFGKGSRTNDQPRMICSRRIMRSSCLSPSCARFEPIVHPGHFLDQQYPAHPAVFFLLPLMANRGPGTGLKRNREQSRIVSLGWHFAGRSRGMGR